MPKTNYKNVPSVAVARKRLTAATKKARAAATAFNKANAVYKRAVKTSKKADTKCRQRVRAKERQCAAKR